MADKPKPKPSTAQVVREVLRIEAAMLARQQNASFAKAIVNALNVSRKPFQ